MSEDKKQTRWYGPDDDSIYEEYEESDEEYEESDDEFDFDFGDL